jgi:hypothetical protein
MVGRRSMADIQVAAKEACANKDSSPMAKADASARVANPARIDRRKRPRPSCLRKGSGFNFGLTLFRCSHAAGYPDRPGANPASASAVPWTKTPFARRDRRKMFAFKDEYSSNSH